MTRRSKKELLTEIMDMLKDGAKNKNEISKAMGANWNTISENLELLRSVGAVEKVENEYRISTDSVPEDRDTMAGIPLPGVVKSYVVGVAKELCTLWEDEYDGVPGKTWLQKALAAYADQVDDRNIPRAWYLYGETVALNLPLEDKDGEPGEDLALDAARDAIEELNDLERGELLEHCYSEADKEDYLAKLEADKALSAGNMEGFGKHVYSIIVNYEYDRDTDRYDDLREMVTYLVTAAGKIDPSDPDEKRNLDDLYNQFWETYAINQFAKTLKGVFDDKYLIQAHLDKRFSYSQSQFRDIAQVFD